MAQWTDPSRTFLIKEIQNRRVIWDREVMCVNGDMKLLKQQAFVDVSAVLNEHFPSANKFTTEDVRSQWKNLKDTFVRRLRWVTEGKYSDDPLKEPTWKFYRMLSFLDNEKDSPPLKRHETPLFDIPSLQREHGMEGVKDEMLSPHQHISFEASNHSAASSEEQMLQFINQSYNSDKSASCSRPSTAVLPSVQLAVNSNGVAEDRPVVTPAHMTTHSCPNAQEEDDEPRRKRPYHRRMHMGLHGHPQDEHDLYGAWIAAQLRRFGEENSRTAGLRLQKALSDVIFDAQMQSLEKNAHPDQQQI